MTAVPDYEVFEAMLRKQILLLYVEKKAPEVLNGLALGADACSHQVQQATLTSILSDINGICAEISKTNPEMALAAKTVADSGLSIVST